jgi:hypothetical protein
VRQDFPTLEKGDLEHLQIKLEPHEVCIRFDLRQPIGRLLEYTRFFLTVMQRQFEAVGGSVMRPRRLGDKWRLYLRALDAKSDGASYAEMAEVFFPPERVDPDADSTKMVEGILRRAKRMTRPSVYAKIPGV